MKKAIIIGATSGIGKALAELLIQKGFQVGLTGRREELFDHFQEQDLNRVVFRKMDVQDLSNASAVCNELVSLLGGLDILIIAAGIGEENKDLHFDIEENVIKTNVLGFTLVADWGLNYFKHQGQGHLVNISSIAGIRGNGIAPSYNASKAYQINYLEGMRLNVKNYEPGITVTDVRPGFIDTAMAKGEGLFWVAPVHKAAEQIFDAIRQKKKVVYITKRWRIIGFLLRIMPFAVLKKF